MAHKCDGCRYKGEHQEMMFRPMGVCNRGANLVEAVKNYEAEKCPYKKTNADRIRAMSDEELASLIDEPELCKGQGLGYCMSKDCKKCILDWLKQPAKDEETVTDCHR